MWFSSKGFEGSAPEKLMNAANTFLSNTDSVASATVLAASAPVSVEETISNVYGSSPSLLARSRRALAPSQYLSPNVGTPWIVAATLQARLIFVPLMPCVVLPSTFGYSPPVCWSVALVPVKSQVGPPDGRARNLLVLAVPPVVCGAEEP